MHLAPGSQSDHPPQPSPLQGHPAGMPAAGESSDLLPLVTFATGPVSFALSAFSNAALTGLGFLKLCLSKDLWSKQGLVCPGRVLDPETVLVLCFREAALPAPSASPPRLTRLDQEHSRALWPHLTGAQGSGAHPPPHPRPSVFVGHVCAQAMQRPGPWRHARHAVHMCVHVCVRVHRLFMV